MYEVPWGIICSYRSNKIEFKYNLFFYLIIHRSQRKENLCF